MSLLSGHAGLERGKASQSTEDVEKQDEPMATGGRSSSLVRFPAVTMAF